MKTLWLHRMTFSILRVRVGGWVGEGEGEGGWVGG